MAFGWLVWSLVLSLVGGDFLRKILCIFLIWLFVCSPVMAASTSDSQLDFDNSIMPLAAASDATVSMSFVSYDFGADSFSGDSLSVVPVTPIVENEPVSLQYFSSIYQPSNPYIGLKVRIGNLSLSKGRSLSLIFNRLTLYCDISSIGFFRGLDLSTLAPIRAYAVFHFNGTGKHEAEGVAPSFISLSGTRTVPLDVSFRNVSTAYSSDGGPGLHFDGYPTSDMTFSFTANSLDTGIVNGREYQITSATVDYVTFYVAFPFSSQNFGVFPDIIFPEADYFVSPVFTYAGGQPCYYLLDQSTASGSSGSAFASLNQSLGSLSQNLTKQINEVKTTVQQGANEVKNEIKSQTQTITDKLTAVKDDIVGGITDLKETTTQGFKDVVQGITDLPGKIGEMLQGLIVPDSEKVSGKFEDFNNLAEEKLGVIYQVPEMVISMAQSIVSGAVEQKGEMTLPKFELIMPATNQSRAGESLVVWEEYTFPIWPEGTEVIHTAVQTATSMLCVILTFNALKRKYEDWLDGK